MNLKMRPLISEHLRSFGSIWTCSRPITFPLKNPQLQSVNDPCLNARCGEVPLENEKIVFDI